MTLRAMKKRSVVLALGGVIAALVALHPPWIARALTMRMSFDGPAASAPVTIVDTVSWLVPFAALYSPPSLAIPGPQQAAYQARVSKGDTSTAREWQNRIEGIERRYRVPEQLRSEWIRDTAVGAPTVAFNRKIMTANFAVDGVRLGVYLLAVGALTIAAAIFTSRRGNSPA